MINIRHFVFNLFSENCYLLWDESGKCAIIDPGCKDAREREQLYSFIDGNGLKPVMILLTHGHLDHIYGVADCQKRYGIPTYLHSAEKTVLEEFNKRFPVQLGVNVPEDFSYESLETAGRILLGDTEITVLPTPGHSPGGVCFYIESEKVLFSGDTLFAGSIGRTDNRWASYDKLMNSLHNVLMKLDGDVDVLTGHGRNTTIAKERSSNPFIYEDFTATDIMKELEENEN